MRTYSYLVFGAALALAGCRTSDCKKGTILVELTIPANTDADTLLVDTLVDGVATEKSVAYTGQTHGSLEIDFPNGYPNGSTVAVEVTARKGNTRVLVGASQPAKISESCERIELTLGSGDDLGVGDMTSADLAGQNADGGACDPVVACAGHLCGVVTDACGVVDTCGAPCQLFEVTPRSGETGATLDLEGTFDTDAIVVQFAGGATAPAMRLGHHRLRVTVPSAAGRGALTVSTGGASTNAIAFSHTSYKPYLAPFSQSYAQTDVARLPPALGETRALADAVRVGNGIYVIGGTDSAKSITGVNTIERATVNADGTLGGFVPSGISLLHPRAGHRALVIGSYVHVIGGHIGGTQVPAPIESAAIDANGNLGAFIDGNGTKLDRFASAAVVVGGWVYLLGGTGSVRPVERAPILANGALGDFAVVPGLSLPSDLVDLQAFVAGDTLYVTGGCGSVALYTSAIDGAGNLSAFAPGASLPQDACGARVLRTDDRVYLVGGADNSLAGGTAALNVHPSVMTAPFVGGLLGSFVVDSTTSLVAERTDAVSFSTGGAFYVCGGNEGTNTNVASCELAITNTSSGVGTFAVASSVGPTSRNALAFAAGSAVYVIGQTGAIQRAPVVDDVIGAFAAYGSSALATPRANATAVVLGNDVYVMGGSNGATQVGTTEHATLDVNGVLSTFAVVSADNLKTPTSGAVAAVVEGNCYVDSGTVASATTPVGTRDDSTVTSTALNGFATFNGGTGATGCAGVVVGDAWMVVTPSGSTERAFAASSGAVLSSMTLAGNGGAALSYRAGALVGTRFFLFGGAVGTADVTTTTFYAAASSGLTTPTSGPTLANATSAAKALVVGNAVYVLSNIATQAAPLQ